MQKPLEVFPHPLGFFPYFTALQENLKMHLFELVYNPFEVLDTNKEKKNSWKVLPFLFQYLYVALGCNMYCIVLHLMMFGFQAQALSRARQHMSSL